MRTTEVPFWSILTHYTSYMEHASKFYGRAWICGRSLQSLCIRCSLTGRSISSSWPLKTWLVPTPPFLPDLDPSKAVIFMTSPKFRSSHWLSYMCLQKVFPVVAASLTHLINLEGDYSSGVAITSNRVKHIFCYWISPGTLGYTLINEKIWVCGPDGKSLVPGRSRDLFPCYCVQTRSGFPLSLLFVWVLEDISVGVNGWHDFVYSSLASVETKNVWSFSMCLGSTD